MERSEQVQLFDFTMAPVHGFVSQARKIIDFWAGSYTVSYLAAHAMHAVKNQHKKNKILFPYIHNDPLFCAVAGEHFANDQLGVASLPNRFRAQCVDPEAAGKAAEKAVATAWHNMGETVWSYVVEKAGSLLTDVTPQSSMPQLWKEQLSTLWELYWVAGGRQAALDQRKNWRNVSFLVETGHVCTLCGERVVAFGGDVSRGKKRALWSEIISRLENGPVQKYDFEDNEELCAVCLVKRLWPRLNDRHSQGRAWPKRPPTRSTVHLCPPGTGEGESSFPYYTVLVMDGDSLGSLLSKYNDNEEKRNNISMALSEFSQQVPYIVQQGEFDGVAVYAGGDDVLALLPARNALRCAQVLRKTFKDITKKYLPEENMTISAALLYVHMRSPMQAAFERAQYLLDTVAKDKMGRDAFVIEVDKRSGTPSRMAKRWDDDEGGNWGQRIEKLAENLLSDESQHSSGFLYRMQSVLERSDIDKNFDAADQYDVRPILIDAYMRGPARNTGISWHEATQRIEELIALCRQTTPQNKTAGVQADAPIIVRFLAQAKGAV